jgi:glucose/arabinose dehydrogenase
MTVIILLLAVIAGFRVPQSAEAAGVGAMRQTSAVTRARRPRQTPHRISLSGDRTFDLYLPEGFAISVAAQGLKRVRFMAKSPDSRIFVTDMYTLADNTKGVVYILDEFNPATRTFKKVTPYLTGLRNPNSIAFFTDNRGANWFYVALTDSLVRYKYTAGETAPSVKPEVLATFPDYGLSYKYGGWHLTRSITIGANGKLYLSVGSSCNACEEKEDVRASVLEMDPDGKNQRHFARGLRNAVGLLWIKEGLFATNMGSDHLGDHKPADTMYSLEKRYSLWLALLLPIRNRTLPGQKVQPGWKEDELSQGSAGLRCFRRT